MNFGLTEITGSPVPDQLITTAEAKEHLRVDIDAEDDLIDALVLAATRHVEEYTSRVLVSRSFELSLDGFPPHYGQPYAALWGNLHDPAHFPGAIYLPIAPLVSVESIRYASTDLEGSPQTPVIETVTGQVDTSCAPPRILPAFGECWPATARVPQAVKIQFTAGYGEPADVPPDIKAAVKLVLGSLFEHREDIVVGTSSSELPRSSKAILAPYRLFQ